MKALDRIKMVKAMEFLARAVNCEDVFDLWLSEGVADGDIRSNSLSVDLEDYENLDWYIGDEPFAGLMKNAREDGGLCFDGVVSL